MSNLPIQTKFFGINRPLVCKARKVTFNNLNTELFQSSSGVFSSGSIITSISLCSDIDAANLQVFATDGDGLVLRQLYAILSETTVVAGPSLGEPLLADCYLTVSTNTDIPGNVVLYVNYLAESSPSLN
jgi:hypothetical protein